MNKIEEGWFIAENADVATPPSSIVLYSISYLPTTENKLKAEEYVKNNSGKFTLNDTECGKKLIALGLETNHDCPAEELMKIWQEASRRFIQAALGDVVAFVDNADRRSIFVTVELQNILENSKIEKINGIDKFTFAEEFKKNLNI